MKKYTLLMLLTLLSFVAKSQTATGNLETYIGAVILNAPGASGDNYVVPSNTDLDTWSLVINAILSDNIETARNKASALNYQVTEFTDTSLSAHQVFYVLEEKNAKSNYWGTYVFSKTPIRNNLVIQAPHSKYDTNTGKQAVYCFKKLVARVLFINGTHRCNNSAFSSCSGTTSVCGVTEAFRVSDLAHSTTSVFQKTTEIVFNSVANSVFVQLHGFGKKSTDPYVILSNGTRDTPVVDYAVQLKEALFSVDNDLTFKIAHEDTSWTRLIGFTNTQGRLINNSTDFCSSSASIASGRFIHVEQEKSKLRNDASGWEKMATALSVVFSSTLDVGAYVFENKVSITPNPTLDLVTIKGNNLEEVELLNQLGQSVFYANYPKNTSSILIQLQDKAPGLYFLKIKSSNGTFRKKIIKK